MRSHRYVQTSRLSNPVGISAVAVPAHGISTCGVAPVFDARIRHLAGQTSAERNAVRPVPGILCDRLGATGHAAGDICRLVGTAFVCPTFGFPSSVARDTRFQSARAPCFIPLNFPRSRRRDISRPPDLLHPSEDLHVQTYRSGDGLGRRLRRVV